MITVHVRFLIILIMYDEMVLFRKVKVNENKVFVKNLFIIGKLQNKSQTMLNMLK